MLTIVFGLSVHTPIPPLALEFFGLCCVTVSHTDVLYAWTPLLPAPGIPRQPTRANILLFLSVPYYIVFVAVLICRRKFHSAVTLLIHFIKPESLRLSLLGCSNTWVL